MSIINLPSVTELSGFYVVYNGSTNNETKGIQGLSHLMEHLLMKSMDPYMNELDQLGINSNAYTSTNEIVFHLSGLDESLSKWRNKFVEKLGNFDITKKEFENEKNIVLQEYADSFNDQQDNHWLNLDRKNFDNYNAIGAKEDLESLTYMDCLNFFEKQFMNPTNIINVSKNIEFGMDIKFDNTDIDKKYEYIKDNTFELQKENEYNNKVSLIMTSDIIEKDFNKIKFVNNMLCNGLQSPLYDEIREKRGLVYFIGMSLSRLNKQGCNAIYTMTTPDNVNKITDIVSTIFDDIDSFLTKERFNVIKDSIAIGLKKADINRYGNVDSYINPDGWSLKEIINDIEYLDVLDTAHKYFKMENFRISRDDQEFK